ncbi:hypothetical protein MNBD_GAMMA06-1590 [hydrothermal vent metagenome]|uniref:Porin n=1 Tax=hydrothermal vent metagenome TaxID=652676 RepID=A0A3B0WIK8_9ZZZZ
MNLNKKLLIKTIGAAIGAVLVSGVSTVHSANWLALQGTEPDGQSARARVWGFVQPEYQSTDGTKLKAGPWNDQNAIFNQIAPDLKTNSQFSIRRARIGVRGTGFPLDNKVNYFFLAEFGNNGITRAGGQAGGAKVTDASVTLSHIPGVRIRAGQFKTPGAEEGLAAIHVFDYVNFTGVTNGLLLERFFNSDGSVDGGGNGPNGSVGAFRDVGIQFFNTFKFASWEHSYALMFGNGNGIARGDNDDNRETYIYWSSELVFGGKGGRRQGWKMFVWNQDGKRTINAGATQATDEFDRTRTGLGTTFRKGKYRAAFEYITADGMIFNGTDGGALPGASNNAGTATASFNMETKGEADGYYGHFGYAIMPSLELDLRYDIYNRMTDVAAKERQFTTTTLGAQYFFNKKSRLIVNYEVRDGEAPNAPGSAGPNQILDGLDDRLSAQLLIIF